MEIKIFILMILSSRIIKLTFDDGDNGLSSTIIVQIFISFLFSFMRTKLKFSSHNMQYHFYNNIQFQVF